MNRTTIGFVQISNNYSNSCYFPYSVGLLQAYVEKHSKKSDSFEFLDHIFNRVPVDRALKDLERAEIVGFSVYVWNYKLSLTIAKKLKEHHPDVLIIFGGPHVPEKAKKFLEKYRFIDIACHQEGEETFLHIAENFNSRNWEEIQSISYIDNEHFVHHPRAKSIKDLSRIPSPYLENIFLNLMSNNPDIEWLGLWETNRGCPFSCNYCDWGAPVHNGLSQFDLRRLENEIEWFDKNKIEFIFCCDANFGILKRDLEIVKRVARATNQYGYPQALSVQNTKNSTEMSYAIQKVLFEAGLNKGVNLALQTVDKDVLENIGRQNISLEVFYELQKKFNKDGIETFTDLILALPGETYASFTAGVSTLIEMGQHHRIQFINLSILPNAAMGNPDYQKKNGFVIVETEIINMHGSVVESMEAVRESQQLVVATKTMPLQDWVKCRTFSWMTALLYFDKLLQIPLAIIHQNHRLRFNELIEAFLFETSQQHPVISEIRDFFFFEARKLQKGGSEFCKSEDWLNMYWPHDEYIFIKLVVEKKIEAFYKEAEFILTEVLGCKGFEKPRYLAEALKLNLCLLKRPNEGGVKTLSLHYNIWEFYRSVLVGEPSALEQGLFKYSVGCSDDVELSFDDWLRKVVWYGNKKGAYLYSVKPIYRNPSDLYNKY